MQRNVSPHRLHASFNNGLQRHTSGVLLSSNVDIYYGQRSSLGGNQQDSAFVQKPPGGDSSSYLSQLCVITEELVLNEFNIN